MVSGKQRRMEPPMNAAERHQEARLPHGCHLFTFFYNQWQLSSGGRFRISRAIAINTGQDWLLRSCSAIARPTARLPWSMRR